MQKFLLFFDGLRNLLSQDRCQHLPEPVLRMSVKEVLFAGFYGWKTAKDQNF